MLHRSQSQFVNSERAIAIHSIQYHSVVVYVRVHVDGDLGLRRTSQLKTSCSYVARNHITNQPSSIYLWTNDS